MSQPLPEADTLVRHAGLLATLRGPRPRLGAALRDLGAIRDAAVAMRAGRIVFVGPDADLGASVRTTANVIEIDAGGAAVIPGFVDAHTHLAYAGDRDDEIRARLAGASYEEIASQGGGIVRTVTATRAVSREDLTLLVRGRLDRALGLGTTSVEVKSGYGLSLAAEKASLEAITAAAASHPARVVRTYLGAHEIPLDRRADREGYIAEMVTVAIPEIARLRLAEFADVFCERGVFTAEESRRILGAAAAAGLALRIHADEFSDQGGAALAAELGARSADHLIQVSDEGIAAMARAGVVATLMPAASFFLKLGRFAPARKMIDAGVSIALGSDTNPGGGLSASIPFAMTLACFGMGLSVEEALSAATIGGAMSLGLENEVGSIEVGKRADLLILRSDRLLDLVRVGENPVARVLANGRLAA
ncbi:MAG: imidazolonepropionase [Vicinamibacteria bacterium]|nr:imidazolonepropionase [Vicinamibacteria bacterium]